LKLPDAPAAGYEEEFEFVSKVSVSLDNVPYDDVSKEDIYDRLESRFRLACNIPECGERTLDEVTIEEERQIFYASSGEGGGSGNTYEYDIRVQGRSRASPSNVRLFGGNRVDHRRISEETHRGLKVNSRTLADDTCGLCPPPTMEEFLSLYERTITIVYDNCGGCVEMP